MPPSPEVRKLSFFYHYYLLKFYVIYALLTAGRVCFWCALVPCSSQLKQFCIKSIQTLRRGVCMPPPPLSGTLSLSLPPTLPLSLSLNRSRLPSSVTVNGFQESKSKFITATWADNQTLSLDSHCLSLRAGGGGGELVGQVGLCRQSDCTQSMSSISGAASTVAPSCPPLIMARRGNTALCACPSPCPAHLDFSAQPHSHPHPCPTPLSECHAVVRGEKKERNRKINRTAAL